MRQATKNFRSYLKNVFWPNVFVGASFKILKIPVYSSGFKLGPAATLNQNPIFEKASNYRQFSTFNSVSIKS